MKNNIKYHRLHITIKGTLFLLATIVLTACVDEFWPEIDKYENVLVVDGFVSDQPGPYEVRLSRSSGVQYPEFKPYSGAQVIISDDQGNSEELTEDEDGHYFTAVDGIQGQVGRSYQVRINTPDEKIYESDYQILRTSVGIDKVYTEFETRPTDDPYLTIYGYQFYVDSEDATTDTAYLLWRIKGTYQYRSDFKIRFYYDDGLHVFPNSDSLFNCWKDDAVDQIYAMNTIGLSEPIINRLPLNFVDTETRKLSVKYSLLVNQISLNKKAYTFYSSLKEMNDNQGLLYSSQPYQVKGNVTNVKSPDEPVLGYFLVGGNTEKRIFVDPPPPSYFHYSTCELGENDYKAYADLWVSRPISWPIYVTADVNWYRAVPAQECMDCTRKGGTVIKPDYWEY